jgi:hypothetical protein
MQLILNKKHGSLTTSLMSLGIFFVMNDGNKLNPILLQIMHCVICHFVCQSYIVGSTTKRRKDMIFCN